MSVAVVLDLGDGCRVRMDMPPPAVMSALQRARDAILASRRPQAEDMELVMGWIEAQDEKYGGVERGS